MSREADLRYTPLCKDLKDVVCSPDLDDSKERKDLFANILTNYIDEKGDNE